MSRLTPVTPSTARERPTKNTQKVNTKLTNRSSSSRLALGHQMSSRTQRITFTHEQYQNFINSLSLVRDHQPHDRQRSWRRNIGKEETIPDPMNKHTRNGHGDRAYVSPDVRAIRLLSPLAVTLLCIAAQGHYITPLVQQRWTIK